ncbi:MAG: lactonase family protein [Tannerella sp.]|jgi:6-phosphogluconolactonase (cycloisomerase 2 family)|nr:lactonase family protein [Tannerella sp.]
MKVVKTICIFWIVIMCISCQRKSELTIVVGTYTSGSSEGIYTYRFNTDDLTVTPLSTAAIDNPSYLAVSPDSKFVYAVSESGKENSAVSAFAFDKEKGTMQFINRVKVEADPCYIILDSKRNFVATANYSAGSVSFVPIATDGRLLENGHSLEFYGKGTDSVRQTKPHLHCLAMAPDKQSLFVTDLGTDRISRIDIHANKKGELPDFSYNESYYTRLEPRSGPRHLIFNRKESHAYLINEISGMVVVFTVDSKNNMEQVQSILADTCYAEGSADIHLSPDGMFLYASTRLKGDGIVIFKVDSEGQLSRVGYQATGKHPRNFIITPDGNLMLVACKDAGMIQIFRINKQTGQLTDSGKSIAIDQPVCIKIIEN